MSGTFSLGGALEKQVALKKDPFTWVEKKNILRITNKQNVETKTVENTCYHIHVIMFVYFGLDSLYLPRAYYWMAFIYMFYTKVLMSSLQIL